MEKMVVVVFKMVTKNASKTDIAVANGNNPDECFEGKLQISKCNVGYEIHNENVIGYKFQTIANYTFPGMKKLSIIFFLETVVFGWCVFLGASC